MSFISADRQNYLVNKITEDLLQSKFVSSSRDSLFQGVRVAVSQFVREWEELEKDANAKIRSIKRGVIPGTAEWDLLQAKYMEESFKKKSSVIVKAQISGASQNKKN